MTSQATVSSGDDPGSLLGRPHHEAASSVELCRRFVEMLVAEALDAGAPESSPRAEDLVGELLDWSRMSEASDGPDSLELAVGRSVLAAGRLANEIGSRPVAAAVETEAPVEVTTQPAIAPSPPSVVATPSAVEDLPVGEAPTVTVPPLPPKPEVAEEHRKAKRRRRLAGFFGWMQFVGLTLCLFVMWQLWGTSISQHHAQHVLAQEFKSHLHDSHVEQTSSPTRKPTLLPANASLEQPAEGSVVARLQIPAIGVDQYVVEGTAEGDLEKGPGHYVGTALPGQEGNVAIAGHRTTYGAPFNNLNNLRPGDLVVLTTDSGEQLRYSVAQSPVAVPPSDVSVLNSFGDNRLTLTTCNPRFSASQRLIAVAKLQNPVAQPPPTASSQNAISKRTQSGLTAADADAAVGWHLNRLPWVILVLILFVLLGIANSRATAYFGRRLRWLILVPLWAAGLYILFGLLSELLPATL